MSENENHEQGSAPESPDDVIRIPTAVVDGTPVDMSAPIVDSVGQAIDTAEAASSITPVPADEPPLEAPEESFVHIERRLGANPNAEQTRAVREPLKPGTRVTPDSALSILGVDIPELNHLADQNYKNSDFVSNESGANWLERVVEAQRFFHQGQALLGSLQRPDSMWRQSVTSGGQQLTAGLPRFEGAEGGSKLTGDHAVMKMQAVLGIGAIVRVPLWHSGLWVCLKAPTEAALLELDRRIAAEKVLLGRVTNGLLFSNTSVYVTSYLVNFALAHVYEASYKFNKTEELKAKIKISDIPTLLWGLIGTIYPNGYPFHQPCVTDPSVCTHITEELLNISKLSWTDDRALTDFQRGLMARKTSKFTDIELARYEEEHGFNKLATLELKSGLTAQLRVPNLEQYEQGGADWVDGIVQQVDQAFGGTIKGEERNTFIMEQGQITALRQYAHWVDKLILNGEDTIEDTGTIQNVLATMTADEEIFNNFFTGIGKFMDATTISLIGIPKFNCPKCGKPMTAEEKAHPHLIPLDVQNVFFTLLAHRINKVLRLSQM